MLDQADPLERGPTSIYFAAAERTVRNESAQPARRALTEHPVMFEVE